MTTITIAHPSDRCPRFQVFGSDGDHVFALKEFEPGQRAKANSYADWLMQKHEADHLKRIK
jgi:hypothetical protein